MCAAGAADGAGRPAGRFWAAPGAASRAIISHCFFFVHIFGTGLIHNICRFGRYKKSPTLVRMRFSAPQRGGLNHSYYMQFAGKSQCFFTFGDSCGHFVSLGNHRREFQLPAMMISVYSTLTRRTSTQPAWLPKCSTMLPVPRATLPRPSASRTFSPPTSATNSARSIRPSTMIW